MTRHLTMLYIGILLFTVSYLCCSWDHLVAVVFSLSIISNLRLRLCSYTPTYVLSLNSLSCISFLRSISRSSSST